MNDEQKQALELRDSGKSRSEIAAIMRLTERQVKTRLEQARRWMDADQSARYAAIATGARVLPHSFWRKEDGVSAYYKVPQPSSSDDLLQRVADAFTNIPTASIPTVTLASNPLLTVYPLYDIHAGMLAWSKETNGPAYDLELFKSDLHDAIASISSRSPDSETALVIFGGDTIHVDNGNNETPQSGHKLDADGRFEKIMDVAIESICHAIELLSKKHSKVKVAVLAGNHDTHSHVILKAALKQRYRDSGRIEFMNSYDGWVSLTHGRNLIFAHHGDKMKPERLAMIASDRLKDWSACKYRVALTGHLHHLKVQDMPGLTHYTLRAFAPADSYGANFGGVRGICAMTFDALKGLVVTVYDNMEREE